MINDLNWDNVFSDNVDLSARLWSQAFLGVMKECIPQRTLKPQKSVPWVTNDIVKLIRDRNICYQRAKRSSDPSQLALYKTLRNKVVDMLRSAKRDFFNLEHLFCPRIVNNFGNCSTVLTKSKGELMLRQWT